ncbi:uncharacterized protein [Panulirus ornatus]|uniref:uncharacterized protein isoform X2 n=2 Tax=Panulirus ornatus TaxID=150431 RepID=UPI003A870373
MPQTAINNISIRNLNILTFVSMMVVIATVTISTLVVPPNKTWCIPMAAATGRVVAASSATGGRSFRNSSLNDWRILDCCPMRLENQGPQPAAGAKLSLITRLGYTDGDDPNPKLMAAKIQDRQISCHLRKKHKFGGSTYDCSPMPLVVLYSLYHDHYIINIKVADREGSNSKKFKIHQGFDHIEDLYVSFISQNGHYTKLLVALQTMFFPAVATLLAWYIRLLWQLCWSFTYFQMMLLFLAVALLLINCPWTYITLLANCPWLVILQDLSHGFFYGTFMTFLHFLTYLYLEPVKRCPKVRTAMVQVISGYTATIFLIDVMEHAILLHNPLPFVWESLHLGLATITVLLVVAYLTYITMRVYSAVVVVRNRGVREDREGLNKPAVDKACELSGAPAGVRWREAMMLVVSWLCILLTAVEFVIKRLHDGMWIWEDIFGNLEIENTSGLLLGVYSMWNVFTCVVLVVYPPVPPPITPQGDTDSASERNPQQQPQPHSRPPLRRQDAIDIVSEDSINGVASSNAVISGDATNDGAIVRLDVISGDGVASSDDGVSVYFISGDSVISGDVYINSDGAASGNAANIDNAAISSDVAVSTDAARGGDAVINSDAAIDSDAANNSNAVVNSFDAIRCDVAIPNNATNGDTVMSGDVAISSDTVVSSDVPVYGDASVRGDVATNDYIAVSGSVHDVNSSTPVDDNASVMGDAALSVDDAVMDIAMIDDDVVSCDAAIGDDDGVNDNMP